MGLCAQLELVQCQGAWPVDLQLEARFSQAAPRHLVQQRYTHAPLDVLIADAQTAPESESESARYPRCLI